MASKIVWLDALLTNVDRTVKNTNMLIWNRELWLIDFGACLYLPTILGTTGSNNRNRPLPISKPMCCCRKPANWMRLMPFRPKTITPELIATILASIPDDWLNGHGTPDEMRRVYWEFLTRRIAASSTFLNTAKDARAGII